MLCGRPGFNPWLGRSPGGGNGNPLQYSCLGSSMDRRAWWAAAPGVAKSRTRLSVGLFRILALSRSLWTGFLTAPFRSAFYWFFQLQSCVSVVRRGCPGLGQALYRRACMWTPGLEGVSQAEPTAQPRGTQGQIRPAARGLEAWGAAGVTPCFALGVQRAPSATCSASV